MGKGVLLPTYAHCPTRAHCANPFGVLHSAHAPLRPGLAGQRRQGRLDPSRRATVARSLRSLRPHHSRTAPGHALRPRWLRCARVNQ